MPQKLTTEILTAAIVGFEAQKKQLDSQIAELRQMLSPTPGNGAVAEPTKPQRKMSAAARRRIAAAQKKRWAEARKEAVAGTTTKTTQARAKKKWKLSAAGRRAIIEATKKRWAAVRQRQRSQRGGKSASFSNQATL
jgi:hypothetical protein